MNHLERKEESKGVVLYERILRIDMTKLPCEREWERWAPQKVWVLGSIELLYEINQILAEHHVAKRLVSIVAYVAIGVESLLSVNAELYVWETRFRCDITKEPIKLRVQVRFRKWPDRIDGRLWEDQCRKYEEYDDNPESSRGSYAEGDSKKNETEQTSGHPYHPRERTCSFLSDISGDSYSLHSFIEQDGYPFPKELPKCAFFGEE